MAAIPNAGVWGVTTVLVIALALAVLPVARVLAWWIAAGAFVLGAAIVLFPTWRLRERQDEQQAVMAALGSTTADLPASMLRTSCPSSPRDMRGARTCRNRVP